MAEPRSAEFIVDKLESVQRLMAPIHDTIVECRQELERAMLIRYRGDPDAAQAEREIYRSNSLWSAAKDLDDLLLEVIKFEQRKF